MCITSKQVFRAFHTIAAEKSLQQQLRDKKYISGETCQVTPAEDLLLFVPLKNWRKR
jgi:hypothetical protein